MEVQELSIEDMESSGFGASSWDHEALAEFLWEAYNERAENDGDTVVIGIGVDAVNEHYNGDIQEHENTSANVVKQLTGIVEEAGFSPDSKTDRKNPVGSETLSSGEKLFKIEMTPR